MLHEEHPLHSKYFLIFSSAIVNAQNQFISAVTPAPGFAQLSQKQQNMLNRVQNNPVYKSYQWVTLGTITDFQDSTGLLTFTIPGRTGTIHVLPKNIQAINSNNYEWYGNLTDNDSTDDVHFLRQSGKTTASFTLAGEAYDIYATDNNIHLLVQYDTAQLNQYTKCGNDTSNTLKSNVPIKKINIADVASPCRDYARVLVLYTPAAKQAVADINQTVNLCVSHFKTAIYNSGITSAAVLELAGSQQYNFIETNSIANDLQHLYTDPNAQALRNNLNADLVILLTNSTQYTGIQGRAATATPTDNLSYAIVQINAAVNSVEAFTHEVGHLYGCRHNIQSDPNGPQFAHGYAYTCGLIPKTYYTVMVDGATIKNTNNKLLNFSNPNVTVHCKPTGTTGYQNNARQISETFNTINGFRPPVGLNLFVSVSGPVAACCFHYVTFIPSYGCGTAPYTFEWRTSVDGINYGSVVGTSENFNEYVPCISQTYQYVKLTVHSADGQTASGSTQIRVDRGCMGFNKSLVKNTIQAKQNQSFIFSLQAVPNPLSRSTNISFKIEKESTVKLEIYNSFGQPIRTIINNKIPAGTYTKIFDVGNLSKGLYVCRLLVDKSVETKYLIIE